MADGDKPTTKRSRAPLSGLLAVPQSAAAPQTPVLPLQGNEASPPAAQDTFQPNYVFTTPANQVTVFCNEIPAIPGISDEDSYLFITRDRDDSEGYRAFVVPKSDPTKQHEIPMTDAVLDTDKKEFRAKLADGHNYVWSSLSAMLDGLHIVDFDRNSVKAHNLIKEPFYAGGDCDDYGCMQYGWTGESWRITTKDYKTGILREFTQEPGSVRGTLVIVQGDPFHGDTLDYHSLDDEMKRAPVSVSSNAAPPADMAWLVKSDESLFASYGHHANQYPEKQQLPALIKAADDAKNPKPDMRKSSSVRRDAAAP
jgi:hypothetical protein